MNKTRLDQALVQKGLVKTRSQAENYIKLGYVQVGGQVVTKPGQKVGSNDSLAVDLTYQYVSRAGLKLASAADKLGLDFKDKIVLDVGSSTGGFTDYALRQGAGKVIAVDVGTDQLHHSLKGDKRIELHEKTDIRSLKKLSTTPDIVLIDVSFISLREILPPIIKLAGHKCQIVALLKPQFEAGKQQINRGVVKNDRLRRQILKDFENWVKDLFNIISKADSEIAGSKGNRERFYLLYSLKGTGVE